MPDYSNYNSRTYGSYAKIWQSTGKCVFCDLRDKYIIKKTKTAVLTVNIFPYIEGHLLIIPLRHIESLEEFTSSEWKEVNKLALLGQDVLKKTLGLENVWLIYRMAKGFKAQKTVAHAHFHLIPYSEKLFKWEFQKIGVSPEDLARNLREKLEGRRWKLERPACRQAGKLEARR